MSFTIDFTKTSRQILLELISKTNNVRLKTGSLLFGTPVSTAEAIAAGRNTKVTVEVGDATQVFLGGGDVFYYDRLSLDQIVGDTPLEMPSDGGVKDLDSALSKIFSGLKLGLSSEDFVAQTVGGHGHSVPYNMPLTVSPDSLVYTGNSFDVGWALFDQLIASAGAQSARYDLRRNDAIFQDSAGATPVTASGQPLGMLTDLFGNGNDATQATSTARPEYWIDPHTDEPVTWYDFVDDKLLWPTVAGAVGTVGYAFSTGAQVFDLTAPAHIPAGPVIEMMFFDRVLTDLECAVLKCYLDLQVKDTEWLGYVKSNEFTGLALYEFEFTDDFLAPSKAEISAEINRVGFYTDFSVDPRAFLPDVVDASFGHYTVALTSARQRFRLGSEHADYKYTIGVDDWNTHTLWTPDIQDKVTSVFPISNIYTFTTSFGSLQILRRGEQPALITTKVIDWNFNNTYRFYSESVPLDFALPAGLVSYDDNSLVSFTQNGLPDFSNCFESLKWMGLRFTSTMTFNPVPTLPDLALFENLHFIQFENVNLNTALPVLPATAKNTVVFYNCGMTGNIPSDYLTNPGIHSCRFNNNQLTGTLPTLSVLNYIKEMDFSGNLLTDYAGGGFTVIGTKNGVRPGPSWGKTRIRLSVNQLSQAAVDLVISDTLAAVNALDAPHDGELHLATGNAAPSAAGLADIATLRGFGWTVTHTA